MGLGIRFVFGFLCFVFLSFSCVAKNRVLTITNREILLKS